MNWSKYWKANRLLSISQRDVKKILLTYPSCSVLDIGSGYGRLSHFLKMNNFDVLAIDSSRKMVKICKNKRIDSCLIEAGNLGLSDNTFDLVITDGLLEHFEDPLPLIKEEARVSSKWVLNFIPRDIMLNKILEKVQKVPQEYRKSESAWRLLHKTIFPKVYIMKLTRLFAIKCIKGCSSYTYACERNKNKSIKLV